MNSKKLTNNFIKFQLLAPLICAISFDVGGIANMLPAVIASTAVLIVYLLGVHKSRNGSITEEQFSMLVAGCKSRAAISFMLIQLYFIADYLMVFYADSDAVPGWAVAVDTIYYMAWAILIVDTLSKTRLPESKTVTGCYSAVTYASVLATVALVCIVGVIQPLNKPDNERAQQLSATISLQKTNNQAPLMSAFNSIMFAMKSPSKALSVAVNEYDINCFEFNGALQNMALQGIQSYVANDQFEYQASMRAFLFSVSHLDAAQTLAYVQMSKYDFYDCSNPSIYDGVKENEI